MATHFPVENEMENSFFIKPLTPLMKMVFLNAEHFFPMFSNAQILSSHIFSSAIS